MLTISTVCLAGVTATWSVDGWLIKASYTNPNPTAGTGATVSFAITYEIDGVLQTTTGNADIMFPIPAKTVKVCYSSADILNTNYTLQDVSGDGLASFNDSGKLVFNVSAPNDGNEHSIQFKLKPKNAIWFVYWLYLHRGDIKPLAFNQG